MNSSHYMWVLVTSQMNRHIVSLNGALVTHFYEFQKANVLPVEWLSTKKISRSFSLPNRPWLTVKSMQRKSSYDYIGSLQMAAAWPSLQLNPMGIQS